MDFKLRTNARHFSDEELLADLRQAARILETETIGERDYLKAGTFSCKPFINRFGSWAEAIKKAGLKVGRETKPTENLLFENLERIWLTLGRQPFYSEIKKPFSNYDTHSYTRRFGGWTKACQSFVRHKQGDPEFQKLFKAKANVTSRTITERMRLHVYKRDNYACVICGRSPATHRGIILHVDHVIPLSQGGLSSLENLQTRCSKCNLGKGNDGSL